jgi:hypothetical protein
MSTTIKAVKATIMLGDIELDVFQLPDGNYCLSKTQVSNSVELDRKRLSQILEVKHVRNLMPQGLRMSEKVSYVGGTKPVDAVMLDEASIIWQYLAITGNVKAQAIMFATLTEALERRADAAFSILRTEEERNERFIARKDSILQRVNFDETTRRNR